MASMDGSPTGTLDKLAAAPVDQAGRLRDDGPGRAALAVVGAVVALSVVRAFLPMAWLGDIWRPADTATIAHNFFVGGMNLFYPQINWGGAGPGYVEAELQILPWISAVLSGVFGEHAWVGRLVALGFTVGGLAVFWALAKRLLPARTARWALVAYVVSPMVMTYGNAFMPDVVVLFFYLLTLLFFERWLAEDRVVWLVAAAAAASLAALAKPTSLHVFLILLIWLAISARDRLRRPSLYVAALASLVAPALWMWHAHELYVTYGNTFGVISGGDSKFGTFAIWTSSLFWTGNLTIEATLVFGIVGVPLALLGAFLAWRHRAPVILAAALPALAVFYVAVGRYSSEFGPQYHIFSLPFAAILVAIGVEGVAAWLRGRVPLAARIAVAVVAVLALSAQSVMIFAKSFTDRSGWYGVCSAQLDQVSQPGDLVVVSTTSNAIDRGTPNNYQEPTVFYLADRKGWSLAADQHVPALLADYATQGARFFVNGDPSLVPAGSPLAEWLATNAKQVRSTAADGCAIWSLRPAG
jgi:hypothetical protein